MTTANILEVPTLSRILPTGSQMVKFGDVVRNVKVSVDPETSGLERYVAGEHMATDDLHVRSWGTIGDGYLGPAFHRKFVQGQVLYGSRRTYLRKVAVAEFDGVCANTTFVLEPANDELSPELLPFIMQMEAFHEHSIKQSKGSVNPYINWPDLEWYEFALPPKDEQRRIAEILWAAESEKRLFHAALIDLERLVALVEIKLFTAAIPRKPTLEQLIAQGLVEFQTGPFGTVLQASSYAKHGTPIINPINMVDRRLVVSDGPFLSNEECERLARYKMLDGDILLGRKGEMGRAVYIGPEYEGYIVGSDCIRVRVNTSEIDRKFFYYFLISPIIRLWLTRNASGTTMLGINEKSLARLEVPIPMKSHQQMIVRRFEEMEEAVRILRHKIEQNVALGKRLRSQLLS